MSKHNGNGHHTDSPLLACMPPSLRNLVRELVRRGQTAQRIMAAVREVDGRRRWQSLLTLQVEAAIEEAKGVSQ